MEKLLIILKIVSFSQAYGVDHKLALAVAKVESSLNPAAYHSKSTATGLFQVVPAYSAYTSEDLLEVDTNIRQGLLRIKHAKRQCQGRYGNPGFMRCYNLGVRGAELNKEAGDRYISKLEKYL